MLRSWDVVLWSENPEKHEQKTLYGVGAEGLQRLLDQKEERKEGRSRPKETSKSKTSESNTDAGLTQMEKEADEWLWIGQLDLVALI